jgi:hypothetical protein
MIFATVRGGCAAIGGDLPTKLSGFEMIFEIFVQFRVSTVEK